MDNTTNTNTALGNPKSRYANALCRRIMKRYESVPAFVGGVALSPQLAMLLGGNAVNPNRIFHDALHNRLNMSELREELCCSGDELEVRCADELETAVRDAVEMRRAWDRARAEQGGAA